MRMMRTLGRSPNCAIVSSNLVAIPKKYGPLISYTSTPAGIIRCSSHTAMSSSSFGSISSLMTDISVVSITRRINRIQAITKPTSMAIVRSKIMVRKKVISNTVTSDLGFFSNALNVRHSLILYDTMTNTPARQAIGMYCARGIRNRRISNKTIA